MDWQTDACKTVPSFCLEKKEYKYKLKRQCDYWIITTKYNVNFIVTTQNGVTL